MVVSSSTPFHLIGEDFFLVNLNLTHQGFYQFLYSPLLNTGATQEDCLITQVDSRGCLGWLGVIGL